MHETRIATHKIIKHNNYGRSSDWLEYERPIPCYQYLDTLRCVVYGGILAHRNCDTNEWFWRESGFSNKFIVEEVTLSPSRALETRKEHYNFIFKRKLEDFRSEFESETMRRAGYMERTDGGWAIVNREEIEDFKSIRYKLLVQKIKQLMESFNRDGDWPCAGLKT